MRAIAGLAAVVLAIAATAACAGTVYTWIDDTGRTQFSDRAPKDFKGPVRRIETDDSPPPAQPAPAAPKEKPAAVHEKPAAGPNAPYSEVATKRRETRERLERGVKEAREKLAAARKALADGQDPKPDEIQVVQRAGAVHGSPPNGAVDSGTRQNCRMVEKGGKKSLMCPVSMPGESYFERIGKLEAAVKAAEEEVADAERAYRAGVD